MYRFYGPLLFANVRYFIRRINELIARETSGVRQVIVDAKAISGIDLTAAEQLASFIENLHARGISFATARTHRPLIRDADQLKLPARHEEFPTVHDAVKAFEERERGPDHRS